MGMRHRLTATVPAPRSEHWEGSVIVRTVDERDPFASGVPSFALIETRGPDSRALLLSVIILTELVSLSTFLGRFPSTTRAPRMETVTLLVAPPDISFTERFRNSSIRLPPAAEPMTAAPSSPELPEPPRPAPRKAKPRPPDLAAAETIPPALIEKPPPVPIQLATAQTPELNPAPAATATAPVTSPDVPKIRAASLGGWSLSRLLEDQDVLAAGLAALPSAQRLGLPRVSIRVNAEWLEALPKTQERLYFSITTPEADQEVLAYVPGTHSFVLERPEHPLWQIHDGEQVPAIAELRAQAARWLDVSPNLVGLYTWHPPVFEDALRMFVLERMQELHTHLGPRDVVTVRLAAGSEGPVMNLEPIREDRP
ncbi:MAG: hypothetical protein P4N24_06365 [Acidobacteriota bacterium]|nr:hypothetical protein [Acidobacteriota bacterium]